MANKNLFGSSRGRHVPATDTKNLAGGTAYKFTTKHALAQIATTGTFSQTYYAKPDAQLSDALKFANEVPVKFLAKCAVYARTQGYMKDLPVFLLAVLSIRNPQLHKKAFRRVVNNGKMLRTYVQIMRSGVVGRKSLGHAPKKLVKDWLTKRPVDRLIFDSVGQNPSMGDVIKLSHPSYKSAEQRAAFGYLAGKQGVSAGDYEQITEEKLKRRHYCVDHLPLELRKFLAFKEDNSAELPRVPFQMLTSLPLSTEQWTHLALNGGWHQTRINLNTYARHGVLKDPAAVKAIAARLASPEAIKKANVFPYQLMAAYINVGSDVPGEIKEALQDAMEIAVQNVPVFEGATSVLVDTSGSMSSPITGYRRGATSVVKCVQVAALIASSILRQNRLAGVYPFDTRVHDASTLNPRDTIMTNAGKLARFGGGGTNCSAALAHLNSNHITSDLVIFVSDNESWVDSTRSYYGRGTQTLQEWAKFKQANPKAKMVCIDLTPNTTTQAKERDDIMNIGGFSDNMFTIIKKFAEGTLNPDHWVGEIERISL